MNLPSALRSSRRALRRGTALACALLLSAGHLITVRSQEASKTPPRALPALAVSATAPASAPAGTAKRDVVIDAPPATVPAAPSSSPVNGFPKPASAPNAGSAARLGRALLGATAPAGQAALADTETNRVLSPLSAATALALLHAATAGPTADELSDALAPASGRNTAFQQDFPRILDTVLKGADGLTSANRLWAGSHLVGAIPADYLRAVRERYAADGALVSFTEGSGQAATQAINAWVDAQTQGKIKQLVGPGALDGTTQVVLTSAMRFKSAWAVPFDTQATRDKPFAGSPKPVPTMREIMDVGTARKGDVTLYRLDLKVSGFAFDVAMHAQGKVDAAADALLGASLPAAAWTRTLCAVEMPRFRVEPASRSLKTVLKAMGVHRAFTEAADFTPLLGKQAQNVKLGDVLHAAGIAVEEAGIEAAAATAAVISRRSITLDPGTSCSVDRPFAFAITHVATGTPVFAGWVVKP